MNVFSKYWLLLPLILIILSTSIFIHLSKESARLNRHMNHLKYTDFISLWWSEGDLIRFYCVPDDAKKVMQEHNVKIQPKQAVYTTFTMPKKDLFAAQDPIKLVTDKVAAQIQDMDNLHLSKFSWDYLHAKAYFRHYSFRQSSFICWTGLCCGGIYTILLLMWSRRRMVLEGIFICVMGIVINNWWYMKPLPSLNTAVSDIVWEWALSGRNNQTINPPQQRNDYSNPGTEPPSASVRLPL